MSITSDAVSYLNKIVEKTGSLLIKSTCSKGELSIQNASHAAKELFTSEIYKHAKRDGEEAIDNPDSLVFSVRSVHALVKSCSKDKVVTRKVALFITAMLEFIVADIIELAGYRAIYKKRKRITVDHVEFGIDEDSELPTTVYRIVI
jgi:histone H2A